MQRRQGPWKKTTTTLVAARAARRPYTGLTGFYAPRTQIIPVRRGATRNYVARAPGGQITAENHYFDTERSITSIFVIQTGWTGTEMDPNTTAMLTLFAPVVGNDIANREGRKVFVKKIRISGSISITEVSGVGTAQNPSNIRIIVYQDKQTNASNTNVAQLLMLSGNATDAVHMFQNTATLGRFKVLKDKHYILQNNAIANDTPGIALEIQGLKRNFKYNMKINQWVNYNGTNGGTVADVVDNSWHLIALTDLGTQDPKITYKVRTVFSP